MKSKQLEFLPKEVEVRREKLGVTGHRTQPVGKESQQDIGMVLGSRDLTVYRKGE